MNSSEKVFYGGNTQFSWKACKWIKSAILSGLEGTFIMHCVAMEGKGVWSLTKKKSWLMDTTLKPQPLVNSMDANGMVVLALQDLMTSTRRP